MGNLVCSAQHLLKQLTTDEGLSDIQCFDVYQDSKGYIWIGTSAGVNRYDGKDFEYFNRSKGLMSDHIYSFHEDSEQRIWINNLNGEPMFIQDGVVHNRKTDPYLNELKDETFFYGWCEDNLKRIWFGHKQGDIFILDKEDVKSFPIDKGIDTTGYDLYGIFQFENEIIIATSMSIQGIDMETLESKWSFPIKEHKAFLRNLILDDKLYLFHLFDSYVFNLQEKKFTKLTRLDGNPSIYDCRVIDNKVLLSTAQGVSIVRDTIVENYDIHSSIDSIAVSALHLDAQQDLWIATLENGVYYYGKSDVQACALTKYKGLIFIEEISIDSLFIVQDDWSVSLVDKGETAWTFNLLRTDENRINNIFYKQGQLWIIDKYKFHMDVGNDYSVYSSYSRDLDYSEERNEIFWVGTEGVYHLNDLDRIKEYPIAKDMIDEEPGLKYYKIHQPYSLEKDEKDNVWVGGEDGLFRIYNSKLEKIDNPNLNGSITSIKLSGDQLIGVNYGNGIFSYNTTNAFISLITTHEGLPASHFSLLDVSGNDVWASHATGISLLRKEIDGLKLIKNFGREHGIPKGGITLLQAIDGVCNFVVNGRTYALNPNSVINDTLEILIDTSSLNYYTDESKIISFDCINYTFADKMHYIYRFLPLDSTWKETIKENIDIKFFPAGNYIFEVKAQHPLKLTTPLKRKRISIQERWYNENYFRFILLALIGLFIYFLVRINAISFNLSNIKQWVGQSIQKYFVNEERNSLNLKDINGVVHLLNTNEIKYIKSSGNYLEFHTDNKKYVSRMTMSSAVGKLRNCNQIQRVHRSYMVNFDMIEAIDHRILKIGNSNIPFTDRYREMIERKLQL